MECACIDVDVDESVREIIDKIVVARKNHECDECHRIIDYKTKYRLEVFEYYGVGRHKTCLICNSVRTEMFCSFIYGQIWERLYDEIDATDGDLPQSHIAALIPGARAKVCDVIEEYWRNHEEIE